MKTFGKVSRVLLLIVLSLALVAGCSSGNSGGNSGNAGGDSSGSADGGSSGGSSSGSSGDSGGSKKYTIAIVPKLVGIPYFNSAEEGAKEAGEDLGVDVIYTGPTQADAAQQATFIQDLITRKVDAIAVSANDPTSLAPILKQARDAGILVITWDSDAQEDAREYFVTPWDMDKVGDHLLESLVAQMGEEGEYAIITGSLTADNLNRYIDSIKRLNEEKYPNLKLVSVVPSDDDQQKAMMQAQNLITAYPDLKGIIGASSAAPPGAAEAVKKAGKSGEIKVVGLSTPNVMRPYLKDGSAQVATLFSPKNLGYATIYVAKQLLDGNAPEDGRLIPKINSRIQLQGTSIITGEPVDFTIDNVDEYDF
jgi:ABC-type sugar transport system substrate-binding protein